jgi:hypothetical protein
MPRTSAIPNPPLPGWGKLDLAWPARRVPALRGGRGGWSGAGEVVAGVLLVVTWALLWAFLIAGVVEPAGDLGARAAAHPSLRAPALLDARPGGEPGPVDTTGRAP